MESYRVTADEAIQKLIAGNQQYIKSKELTTDVSPDTLLRFSSLMKQYDMLPAAAHFK